MLCLGWNSKSLQNFLEKNISVPGVLQKHQFQRSKSATTMTTTKMCHFLLERETQLKMHMPSDGPLTSYIGRSPLKARNQKETLTTSRLEETDIGKDIRVQL